MIMIIMILLGLLQMQVIKSWTLLPRFLNWCPWTKAAELP